jgi:hypothetical protein
MKIVINECFGGFGLSKEAYDYLGLEWDGFGYAYCEHEDRANTKLVECVETLGDNADGTFAKLKIVDIPDDVEWEIEEYDGVEWVSEKHRRWS